jgi:hypothetical protein
MDGWMDSSTAIWERASAYQGSVWQGARALLPVRQLPATRCPPGAKFRTWGSRSSRMRRKSQYVFNHFGLNIFWLLSDQLKEARRRWLQGVGFFGLLRIAVILFAYVVSSTNISTVYLPVPRFRRRRRLQGGAAQRTKYHHHRASANKNPAMTVSRRGEPDPGC